MLLLRIRTVCLLFLSLFALIILPGCWNSHELNEEYILLAESIDKVGDHIQMTFQLIAPDQATGDEKSANQSSSSSQSPFFLVTAEGKTVAEAIKKYHTKLPRFAYAGHLEAMFISEDAAREGIMPDLDLYSRHYWSLDSSWLIITRGPARDMLEVINPMLKYPTMGLEQVVQKKAVKITTLSDMLLKYQNDSGMQVLSTAKIETSDESKRSEMKRWLISNTALFQHDRLVGFLTPKEGESYNYFIQGFNHADFPLKSSPFCTDGDLTVMLNGDPPKIIATPTAEGLSLSIKANLVFELTENTCSVKLTVKDIGTLEESVNKEVSESLERIIRRTQQVQMDVFDVADSLHAGHPQLWNEVKENWPEVYSRMPLQIEVNARYRNSRAMLINPGYKE